MDLRCVPLLPTIRGTKNTCRRKKVSQFKLEQLHRLKALDLVANKLIDAIINQQDVFQAAHNAHLPLIRTLHKEAVTKL